MNATESNAVILRVVMLGVLAKSSTFKCGNWLSPGTRRYRKE
jgi:hypothetical protein